MGNFLPISRKGIQGTCQQASHWTAATSQSVLYLPLVASQQGLFCLNEGADTSSVSLCLWNSNKGQFLWENWVSFCFASSSPKAKLGFHFPSFFLNKDQKELDSLDFSCDLSSIIPHNLLALSSDQGLLVTAKPYPDVHSTEPCIVPALLSNKNAPNYLF